MINNINYLLRPLVHPQPCIGIFNSSAVLSAAPFISEVFIEEYGVRVSIKSRLSFIKAQKIRTFLIFNSVNTLTVTCKLSYF